MYLTERVVIRKKKCGAEIFNKVDTLCYKVKNLHNYTNYIINCCWHTYTKQALGLPVQIPDEVYTVNRAIDTYNLEKNKDIPYIGNSNGRVNENVLKTMLKTYEVYTNIGYAVSAQQCIGRVYSEWKSFFALLKSTKVGKVRTPGYLDKVNGRDYIILTSQNFKVGDNNVLELPGFLNGLQIKVRYTENLKELKIITKGDRILCYIVREVEEAVYTDSNRVMSIDLGVNNLAAVVTNISGVNPLLVSGKLIKSVNQHYNKLMAHYKSKYTKGGKKLVMTKRMLSIVNKRNRKVEAMMHRISKEIVTHAVRNKIAKIIIGKNTGWKSEVDLGTKINQNFVSIPYNKLIHMITYKAKLQGVEVIEVEESYTSGTSYLDKEYPCKENYNLGRRVKRGLFESNTGVRINSDINSAYQIMKKAGIEPIIKGVEPIEVYKVA